MIIGYSNGNKLIIDMMMVNRIVMINQKKNVQWFRSRHAPLGKTRLPGTSINYITLDGPVISALRKL